MPSDQPEQPVVDWRQRCLDALHAFTDERYDGDRKLRMWAVEMRLRGEMLPHDEGT
jgi:hypothetical protein